MGVCGGAEVAGAVGVLGAGLSKAQSCPCLAATLDAGLVGGAVGIFGTGWRLKAATLKTAQRGRAIGVLGTGDLFLKARALKAKSSCAAVGIAITGAKLRAKGGAKAFSTVGAATILTQREAIGGLTGLIDTDHLVITELATCAGPTNGAAFADLDKLDTTPLIATCIGFAIGVLGAARVAQYAFSCRCVATLGGWAVCVAGAGRWCLGDADARCGIAALGRWAVCVRGARRLNGDALVLAAGLVVCAIAVLAAGDARAIDAAQVVGAIGVLGASIGSWEAAVVEAKVARWAVSIVVAAAVSATLWQSETDSFGACVVVAGFLAKRAACTFGAKQPALAGRAVGIASAQEAERTLGHGCGGVDVADPLDIVCVEKTA